MASSIAAAGGRCSSWRCVFGVLNASVRPLLKLLSLPILILTLGLFIFVINALMLLLTGWVSGLLDLGFYVEGFWAAFVGGLIVSIVSLLLSIFTGVRKMKVHVESRYVFAAERDAQQARCFLSPSHELKTARQPFRCVSARQRDRRVPGQIEQLRQPQRHRPRVVLRREPTITVVAPIFCGGIGSVGSTSASQR